MKTLICSISFLGILLFSNSAVKANENSGTEITNKAVSTFEISSMKITDDEMLCWTSTNENGSLPYYVEQFIFNRWVEVAHVDGAGKPEATSYSVQLCLTKGVNKFRLKQKGYDKKTRFSAIISFFADKDAVAYTILNDKKYIQFSDYTNYFVYNAYGEIIQQGISNSLNTEKFENGSYCIVFDNKLVELEKKQYNRKKRHRSIRNPYSRYKID